MIDIEEVSIASSLSSMSDEDEEDDYDILRTEYRAVSFPSEKSNEEEICSVETAKKKDITTLSDLIINRKWKVARERMASHPEEVSEEISLRCFAGGNCKGLPLHLACSMRPLPPPSFTTSLMSYFPAASSTKERLWGMLPLHFACMRIKEDDGRNINNAILNANRHVFAVDSLIKANPQAVRSRESFQGKLPIHMAAASYSSGPSYPQVVKTLARAYPQSMHEKDYYGETPLDIARRIHQWHQYCVDEEKDDFTKNASEIELEEVDTDSISMMFEQPLVQQNQTEQSNAINPISVFLILSLFHNTLGNISPTATDNLEAKYRAIVFDVQGKIKRKKLSKKISKWNKISPFFDVFIGQNKPQGKKQSWTKIYRSYPIMNNRRPKWEKVWIEIDSKYTDNVPIMFTFIKCNRKGFKKQIGMFQSTLKGIFKDLNECNSFEITKGGNKTGVMTITTVSNDEK